MYLLPDKPASTSLAVPDTCNPPPPGYKLGLVISAEEDTFKLVQVPTYHMTSVLGSEVLVVVSKDVIPCYWNLESIAFPYLVCRDTGRM